MFQIGALNYSGVAIPSSKGVEVANVDKTPNLKRDQMNSNAMKSIFYIFLEQNLVQRSFMEDSN